jgi:hypothetical protein
MILFRKSTTDIFIYKQQNIDISLTIYKLQTYANSLS